MDNCLMKMENILYPTNWNIPSSINQPGSMVDGKCEFDMFYDTLVACGCSKSKWLKKNPQHVTLSHYIND